MRPPAHLKTLNATGPGNRQGWLLFGCWLRFPVVRVSVFALSVPPLAPPARMFLRCSGLGGRALLNCLLLLSGLGSPHSTGRSGNSNRAVAVVATGLLVFYLLKRIRESKIQVGFTARSIRRRSRPAGRLDCPFGELYE